MIFSPCKTCSNREFPKELRLDACKKIEGVQALLLIMPGHDLTPLSREFLIVALLTIQSKCNIETPTVHEPYPYFQKNLSRI
jgi:hypothetical protein